MPDSQDIMLGARVAHVRELKAEVAALKADNIRLRDELESLRSHFDLALTAAADLRRLSGGGRMILVDGWNLILGAHREARDRDELVARWERHLAEHPSDAVWIVFDGPREHAENRGRLRISYTGGTGAHRADRLICDFLRMASYLGLADRVEVRTDDRDVLRTVRRLKERQTP